MRLDTIGKSTIARWNRRADAERKTPHVIEHRKGWKHPRRLRLGSLSILDWGDGPRLDPGGGVVYGLPAALESYRIPTAADAAAIDEADAVVTAAYEAAERVYLRAFRHGRKPSVQEIQAANAQVKAEAPE